MSDPVGKLKKLRTFYDDVAKLQTGGQDVMLPNQSSPDPLLTPKLTNSPTNNQLPETGPESEVIADPISSQRTMPVSAENLAPEIEQPNLRPQIDVSALKTEAKESLLSGHGAIFSTIEDSSEIEVGNIITDQKRERFKLLPAMGVAIRDWFNFNKYSVKKLLEPKVDTQKISDAASRRDVIKEAGENSAMAPKDDYQEVAERIKREPKPNHTPATLVIKKPAEVSVPSWSYLEEDNNEQVATQKEGLASVIEETDNINPPIAEAIQEVRLEDSVVEPSMQNSEIIAETQIAKLELREPTTVPTVEVPSPADLSWFPTNNDVETTKINQPEFRTSQAAPQIPTYRSVTNTTEISLWRIGAVATLAILLGVIVTLWWFNNGETPAVVSNQNQFNTLIKVDEVIPIALGVDSQNLLRNIQAIQPRPTSIGAVTYPVVNIAGIDQPASVVDILSVADWQATGSFLRSITDINFGIYRNRDPFVVLKVTSFDIAFGGILAWERTMSSDLSPLFGAPVFGTFDPLARTATQIRDPYFVDVVVANIDSRLLTDETQKERLVYAFVDRNTIIITTNRSTLRDLLNLLR